MSQVRKTRQQKIKRNQSQTKTPNEVLSGPVDAVSLANGALLATELAKPSLGIDSHIQAIYSYAWEELRRIGWISLVCIGLLLIACLFLSEIPAIADVRNLLHLPLLSPLN